MSFLKELVQQLRSLWNRWSLAQRIGMIAAVVAVVVTMLGVGYWASSPEYVILADHLSPAQTAEYVSALEAANLPYKLNFSGSAILVARAQLSQARVEARDLIDAESDEPEMAESLWSDPGLRDVRVARQQELRLARTLEQMQAINKATVHITQSDSSPFVRDRVPAKASITVELKRGVPFHGSDAMAIVSTVAHSVENLLPENVTVVSTDGRVLSSQTGLDGDIGSQLEYRSLLETNLAAKAENLLTPLLGLGNATVRVTADVDFTQTERTQRKIDPDSKAKVKEELHSESTTTVPPPSFGAPGTSSNLNVPNGSLAASSPGNRESEDVTTEYINGETTDLIREQPGRIQRLTVAAVVQLPEESTPEAGATTVGSATNGITSADVEAIIKRAVGFDETRGDEIQVVAAHLAVLPSLITPVPWWENLDRFTPLVRAGSLGLAALVAFALGLTAMRRIKPVVIETKADNALSSDVVERLNALSAQMRDHPEAVTRVLATWLEPSGQEETSMRRAA